ncbi:MAG TPA: hypothetical protein VM778_10420, partial [Gemmatimonadota bacterium]|nr:hypothetical protein [Gemmatimonadota bacterium]
MKGVRGPERVDPEHAPEIARDDAAVGRPLLQRVTRSMDDRRADLGIWARTAAVVVAYAGVVAGVFSGLRAAGLDSVALPLALSLILVQFVVVSALLAWLVAVKTVAG